MKEAEAVFLSDHNQFRIIPSVLPTINFFEGLVDPDDMEIIFEIESLTNDRLRQEVGDIFLVPRTDRVSGYGSSVVMAAFTHIGKPTRFSDGSYGVYYASFSVETAIRETSYHRARFLNATKEPPCELTMRLYRGKILKPLYDIRDEAYMQYHQADDYNPSQIYGRQMRDSHAYGLIYNSVRHTGGTCLAIFRPPAISLPEMLTHLRYVWNGEQITDVFDVRELLRIK